MFVCLCGCVCGTQPQTHRCAVWWMCVSVFGAGRKSRAHYTNFNHACATYRCTNTIFYARPEIQEFIFSPLRSWYIESGIVKWHLIHFNSLSRVFLCNTPLLTNTFFFSLPARVEMAITADGSLVFAVIFLTASCIDFVKPLINLRQELDRSVVTAKLPWITQWFLLQFHWPGEVYLEKRCRVAL